MSVSQPSNALIPMNASQPMNTTPGNSNASLYVGDLDEDVSEAMIFEKFSKVGQILSIRVCRDMISKKSLGYAYVNFSDPADAERAIDTLNFDTIRGRQMRIMWSQRDPSLRRSGVGNLFIKNLEKSVTTRELYDTFSLFGEILSCKITSDEKGISKGYGFIHFSTNEAAEKAIDRLNEKVIKSKKIFVAHFLPRTQRVTEGSNEPSFNNLFIKNFGEDMDDARLRKLFSQYGEVTSVKVEVQDGKSRGFGFVCFKEPKCAVEAVKELNGSDWQGKPLFVGRAMKKSERAEVLRHQYERKKMDKTTKFQVGVNLYVKNLDDSMDDENLRAEFTTFGKVTSVRVMRDSGGRSKGFGFVCFSSPEEATKAVTDMNGRLINGKPLYVALAQRKEERRAHLANQYMQRQFAMRSQIPPQNQALMNAAQQQANAMNIFMTYQGQNSPAFFPNVRGMMAQQPQMSNIPFGIRPTRWQTPQQQGRSNTTAGPMSHPNFQPQSTQMLRGQNPMQMNSRGPRPLPANDRSQGLNPAVRAQGSNLHYTANARNLQSANNMSVRPLLQPVQPAEPISENTLSETDKQFMSTVSKVNPEEQKQMLGEKIYNIIQNWYPEQCGKLTGMILELENRELLTMYHEAVSSKMGPKETALKIRVDAAHQVLQDNKQKEVEKK